MWRKTRSTAPSIEIHAPLVRAVDGVQQSLYIIFVVCHDAPTLTLINVSEAKGLAVHCAAPF